MDEFRNIQSDIRDEERRDRQDNDRYGNGDRDWDHNRDFVDRHGDGYCRDRSNNCDAFLYPCSPVLQQAVGGLPPLPVPIDANLPHFLWTLAILSMGPIPLSQALL